MQIVLYTDLYNMMLLRVFQIQDVSWWNETPLHSFQLYKVLVVDGWKNNLLLMRCRPGANSSLQLLYITTCFKGDSVQDVRRNFSSETLC